MEVAELLVSKNVNITQDTNGKFNKKLNKGSRGGYSHDRYNPFNRCAGGRRGVRDRGGPRGSGGRVESGSAGVCGFVRLCSSGSTCKLAQ